MPPLKFYHPTYWLTWFALALLRITVSLPHKVALKLGSFAGYACYFLMKKRRYITTVNLKLCFPKKTYKEINQLTRSCFSSVGMGVVEIGMAWWQPIEKYLPKLTIKGEKYLKEAQAKGQGVLLIGAHFTTLDLAGSLIASKFPICTTYRASKNKLINWFMVEKRKRFHKKCFERQEMRKFIRALMEGKIVWYAPDQDYGRKVSVFSNFFGVPAATITTTAKIAKLTNALIIPISQYRLENGNYLVEISPPLAKFPTGDEQKDANLINKIIEQAILKYPEQYLWQHKRFKTRPIGDRKLY